MPVKKNQFVLIDNEGTLVHVVKNANAIDLSKGYGLLDGEWYRYDRDKLNYGKDAPFALLEIPKTNYGKLRHPDGRKCTVDKPLKAISIREGVGA